MLVITLVAAGLLASGLFLFSPSQEETGLAATDGPDAQPFLYINPQPEPAGARLGGEDSADIPSDAEGEEDARTETGGENQPGTTDKDEDQERSEPLIFTQRQVYGQTREAGEEHEDPKEPSTVPSSESEPATGTETRPQSTDQTGASDTRRTASADSPTGTPGGSGEPVDDAENRGEDETPAVDSQSSGRAGGGTSTREPVTVQEYWIQVFASPSIQSIEDARHALLEHGFGGKVSSVSRADTLYYRLRYGPFQVEDEAEKFLGWITTMEEFSDAYISLEYNRR